MYNRTDLRSSAVLSPLTTARVRTVCFMLLPFSCGGALQANASIAADSAFLGMALCLEQLTTVLTHRGAAEPGARLDMSLSSTDRVPDQRLPL